MKSNKHLPRSKGRRRRELEDGNALWKAFYKASLEKRDNMKKLLKLSGYSITTFYNIDSKKDRDLGKTPVIRQQIYVRTLGVEQDLFLGNFFPKDDGLTAGEKLKQRKGFKKPGEKKKGGEA